MSCLHYSILDTEGEQKQWKWDCHPDEFTAVRWDCQHWNMVSLFVLPLSSPCFLNKCSRCRCTTCLFVSHQVGQNQCRCDPRTVLSAAVGSTQVNWSVTSKHLYFIFSDQQHFTSNFSPIFPLRLQRYISFKVYRGMKNSSYHTMCICLSMVLNSNI